MISRTDFMTAEGPPNKIEKIGRYRVTGELGRGGMGVVYRAEDRLIGRLVAIKTLTEVTPELRERFYVEARSGILSHPNIVTVYELGEHEGNPFIAMEYVDGDSLEKILRQRKRLPLLEAISIVDQLCTGLGYAHGHGVVHRDVKPANILVRPDGHVTIVDFGIARLADQTRQLTKTDTLLGTFHYIAPERLKAEVSDGRADVWSVGVMLYEMLTGELPFKGSDISSLYRVIHEPYVPFTEYVQDLPDGVGTVLDRALAKEADQRYATAEEMAVDLQLLTAGLKHDRVGSLLETARRLTEETQYGSARTVLLQAQRIDPANVDAKILLSDVQDRLSYLQRGEQLRQIIAQAEDAANGRRWNDAIAFYQQARKLDAGDTFNLGERIDEAQQKKVLQVRVLELCTQAEEARVLGDLAKAQDYLGQALKADSRSTEVRNAYSDVLREVKHKQQQFQVEELLKIAQEESDQGKYTKAIAHLREAIEIDPAHADVLTLLLSVEILQNETIEQSALQQASWKPRKPNKMHEASDDDVTQATQAMMVVSVAVEELTSTIAEDAGPHEHSGMQVTQQTVKLEHASEQSVFSDKRGDETELHKLPESRREIEDKDKGNGKSTVRATKALTKQQSEEVKRLSGRQSKEVGANGATDRRERRDDSPAEIHKAISKVLAEFDIELSKRKLETAMRPLDQLVTQFGENELIANLRHACEVKREHMAVQLVHDATHAARRYLKTNANKKAQNALREVEHVVQFARQEVRLGWEQIKIESELVVNPKRHKYYTAWRVFGSVIAIIGFMVASRLHRHRSTAIEHVMKMPTTDMELNASPWGTVVSVRSRTGEDIRLPNTDRTTPLRLDGLNIGKYQVTFSGPNTEQQVVSCEVSESTHLCIADFGPVDINQILAGDQQ